MRKLMILTKILLKSGLGMSSDFGSGTNKKNKNKFAGKTWLLMGVIFLCLLPLMKMFYDAGFTFYFAFSQLSLPELPVQLFCYLGAFAILFFAIPYVLSVFFLSKDLHLLLPLPLKSWQIVGAKYIAILINEYFILLIFIVPPFLGYAVASEAGILFAVYAAVVILLLPIIPLVYASLLGILLMRLFKNFKNKELITTLGSIVLIILIVGANMMLNNSHTSTQALADIVVANRELLAKINYLFPNLIFTGDALVNLNPLSLLCYILITAAIMVLFLVIANRFYLSGVLGMSEVTAKHRKLTQAQKTSYSRKRSPVLSYAVKEVKTLLRTPVFMLNCILTPVIMPLIMFFGILVSMLKNGSESSQAFSLVFELMGSENVSAIVLIAIFGMTTLSASCNLTSSTCISREGQGYIFMKYNPMSYKDQLRGKLLCGLFIGFLATLPYCLIFLVLSVVMFHANPLVILAGLGVQIVTLLFINYAQLWGDLTFPKLTWENEQSAVKQNLCATFMMLGFMVLSVLAAIGISMVYLILHLPALVLALLYMIIMGGLNLVMRTLLFSYGTKKLTKLET